MASLLIVKIIKNKHNV